MAVEGNARSITVFILKLFVIFFSARRSLLLTDKKNKRLFISKFLPFLLKNIFPQILRSGLFKSIENLMRYTVLKMNIQNTTTGVKYNDFKDCQVFFQCGYIMHSHMTPGILNYQKRRKPLKCCWSKLLCTNICWNRTRKSVIPPKERNIHLIQTALVAPGGRSQGKQHCSLRTKALMQGLGTKPDC